MKARNKSKLKNKHYWDIKGIIYKLITTRTLGAGLIFQNLLGKHPVKCFLLFPPKGGVWGGFYPKYIILFILLALFDRSVVTGQVSDNRGLSSHSRGGTLHTHNRPLNTGNGSAYEGGIREPMIVKWPGRLKKGTVCNDYLIIEDFFPTIMEIAGVDEYNTVQIVDGISFMSMLLQTGTTSSSRALFWHYPNSWGATGPGIGTTSTIRSGDWKLIYWYKDQNFELFNISDDIGEHNNLAGQYPEKKQEFTSKLGIYLRQVGALRPSFKETGRPVTWPDQSKNL